MWGKISIKNAVLKNENLKKIEKWGKLTTDFTDYADFGVENEGQGVGL